MNKPHVWLRAETKPHEQRTALTPTGAAKLVEAGFRVTIEDCKQRMFGIDDYRETTHDIAGAGDWRDAPRDAFVLGLKELTDEDFPLEHRHIHFAHVYKEQDGAERMLKRFVDGGGTLYDLEYLVDENGRRVAAFGYWAGFCGAALGVMAWANQQAGDVVPLKNVTSRESKDALLKDVSDALTRTSRKPTVMVIGARGRSGRGAVEFARALGLDTVEWDMAETQKGGPFPEINAADVFVNCVFVSSALPPFVTMDSLSVDDRRLSVIADVSCDPHGDYNPVPIYSEETTFVQPCLEIIGGDKPLHLIGIDHLPSLLPRESSEDYGAQLLPVLKELDKPDEGVWGRAYEVFVEKTRPLRGD